AAVARRTSPPSASPTSCTRGFRTPTSRKCSRAGCTNFSLRCWKTSASLAAASSAPTWGRCEVLHHARVQVQLRLAGAPVDAIPAPHAARHRAPESERLEARHAGRGAAHHRRLRQRAARPHDRQAGLGDFHRGRRPRRDLGGPARYVSGYVYAKKEDNNGVAMHAWVEAWVVERWRSFDIAHDAPVGEAHIKIAVGADYLDACPVRGVRIGGGAETLLAHAHVEATQQ